MVTSVWGTENNQRVINQGSRADDGARALVCGLKVLVQQLPGEPVHCREEGTNCLVLSTRAGHGKSSSIGVPEHSNIYIYIYRERERERERQRERQREREWAGIAQWV